MTTRFMTTVINHYFFGCIFKPTTAYTPPIRTPPGPSLLREAQGFLREKGENLFIRSLIFSGLSKKTGSMLCFAKTRPMHP